MTTVGVLGTLENRAENSEVAAQAMERGGMRVVRIHRDEPLRSKLRKISASDVIYGTGFGFAWKLFLMARIEGKRTINHWMGTDVLLATHDRRKRSMAKLAALFTTRQLAQAPWLAEELRPIGIDATVLPIAADSKCRSLRAGPAKPGVLTYIPDHRAEFYGAEQIHRLAAAFPDLPFCIVAGVHGPQASNVRYYGWVEDLSPLYDDYPILVRLAQHDGLPKMVLEALSTGNQVIFKYPFPHCHRASTFEEASVALRAILDAGCPVNVAGHEHVIEQFDPTKLRDKLIHEIDPTYGG